MNVVAVTGAKGTDTRTLVERLAERLHERGRVATVRHPRLTDDPDSGHGDADGAGDAVATYELGTDGWRVSGEDVTLGDALDHLAPTYDFAVLEGYEDTGFLEVALGEGDGASDVAITARSAGAVDVDALADRVAASDPHETLASLLARAKASPDAEQSGAIATFTGRVRAKEHDDDVVTERLEFERHDEVAAERTDAIREDLEAREGVFEVLLHHRVGVVEYGEDIVFVVVLAGHRDQAFRAVRDGIDRLKEEVPLFKKEVTVEGEFWAHEADE